jgi:hypothetical protein
MKMKMNRGGGFLAVWALVAVLVSCDKGGGYGVGEAESGCCDVVVRLLGVAEGGEEDVVRSAARQEPELVVRPAEGGILAEMQLERDTALLRTVTAYPLTTSAWFRVIAVTSAGKYVSHGDFQAGSGTTSLSSFCVPENVTYDFICFSYNDTDNSSLPAFSPKRGDALTGTLGGDMEDLLWCKWTQAVTDVAPTLNITLKHVMARIKVALDCRYNEWTITGFQGALTMTGLYGGGTIDLLSGAVATTEGELTLGWTGASAGYVWESDVMYAMPASGYGITVPADAVAIAGNDNYSTIPVSEATGTFVTELMAGNSYRLCIRLRRPKWAGSNIYWDDSAKRLTFDEYYPDGDDAPHRGYQGVFFKWGSLIGISPAYTVNQLAFYSNVTPVYEPYDYPSDPKWRQTTKTRWTDISSLFGTLGNGRNDTYAIDADRNTTSRYQGLRGDICQYLSMKTGVVSGDYRLPIAYEFGNTMDDEWGWNGRTDGWIPATNFSDKNTSVNAFGTYNIIGSATPPNECFAKNIRMDDVVFPASGLRDTNGKLGLVGTFGNYSCGSSKNTWDSYMMFFDDFRIYPDYNREFEYGMSVRCVMN